ncbi:hypothetical protein KCU92_g8467, partial [Aureobasidium melanogenum]
MSEFIGSRISLISKSDIKYLGTLHEINSENSTVALENVKSFGTEGRRGNPDDEIPPNDQIYDYIVFRGSDVKDLTIVEPPKENKPQAPQMPNDPAILGAARPHGAPGAPQAPSSGPQGAFPQPNQQQQQQWRGPQGPQGPQQPPPFPPYGYPPPPQGNSRFGPPAGPHGFPNAPPQFYGPPPPGWFPPPGQGFPQGPHGQFPPQPIGPPGQQPQPQQQRSSDAQTPAPSKKQPESAKDTTAFPPQVPDQQPASSANQTSSIEAAAPPPPVDSKPDVAAATAPAQSQQKPPTGPKNTRVAVPLVPLHAKPGNAPTNLTQQQQSATQTAAAAVAAAMAKLPISAAAPTDASVDNLTKRVGDMRTDDRTRQPRQPGAGGFPAGHRGGRGGRRPSNRDLVKPVEVPTTDFDFETSNAKFNKQDLVKEAIASGSPLGTPADEPQEDALNGHEAPQAEREVVIPGATYNKSSSFFDNISSELKDRQAAQEDGRRMGGMEFRTEERKKNFETFGQANVDNGYRGGFRGRGRGRGYGRGGQRGGFAPRGGYAPRGRGASFAGES